jgi:hypothetical protein
MGRTTVFQRRYRMDAGAGNAYIETTSPVETTSNDGAAVALQFAAGSLPARAHGFQALASSPGGSECVAFLRLTFEAELEATEPTIPSVFPEESA